MMRTELLALLSLAVGCGSQDLPDTLPELRHAVVKLRADAELARKEREPERARRAADRAGLAGKKAEILVSEEEKPILEEILLAVQEAQRFALLAEEEKRLRDRTSGFKAKLYRGARSVALTATFEGLALTADRRRSGASTRCLKAFVTRRSRRLAWPAILRNARRARTGRRTGLGWRRTFADSRRRLQRS